MKDLFYGSLVQRETLAEAITAKGVNTNASDTLETMAGNISQLNSDKLLGTLTYTAANQNKTLDVSSILSNYRSLTVKNFKAYIADSDSTKSPGDPANIVLNFKAPTVSYDATTGILTVKGGYCSWSAANWSSGSFYFSKVAIVYVAG